jgi:hypothetical protein
MYDFRRLAASAPPSGIFLKPSGGRSHLLAVLDDEAAGYQ